VNGHGTRAPDTSVSSNRVQMEAGPRVANNAQNVESDDVGQDHLEPSFSATVEAREEGQKSFSKTCKNKHVQQSNHDGIERRNKRKPKLPAQCCHHQYCARMKLCCQQWWHEGVAISRRNVHGGDYRHRVNEATRASLGSLILFSSFLNYFYVFPSLWISNIFHHVVIAEGSVGACAPFSKSVIRTLVLVMCLSWPINLFLLQTSSKLFGLLLPIFTAILTLIIMLCPWFTLKNLMLLYMFLVIQSGCRSPMTSVLYPLQLSGSCALGCIVATGIAMLPLPKPASAILKVRHQLKNSQQDAEIMLAGVQSFMACGGANLVRVRRAVSSIELAIERMETNLQSLKKYAAPARWELGVCYRFQCNMDPTDSGLQAWIETLTKQLEYSKMIRFAVVQRLLGEQATTYHSDLKEAKTILSLRLQDCMNELIENTTNAMAFCNCSLKVIEMHTCSPKVSNEKGDVNTIERIRQDTIQALESTRRGLAEALDEAEELVMIDSDRQDHGHRKHHHMSTPSFAFIIRRIQLCHGLFGYSEEISKFMEKRSNSARKSSDDNEGETCVRNPYQATLSTLRDVYAFFVQPWPKYSPESYRLPLKAALGMAIASLFVAVPALYEIAKPNAVWPALTVASVNLGTTGSSFTKATDRLRGTLIASAFALLLSELLGEDGNMINDWIKIPSLTLFTFVAIYLKDPAHSYEYTYAATSIGSMLYGSVAFDYNLNSYIPKRIALIFMGVLIFAFVEMFVFPRSSKELVQTSSLTFFGNMKGFLDTAAVSLAALSLYVPMPAMSEGSEENSHWDDGFFVDACAGKNNDSGGRSNRRLENTREGNVDVDRDDFEVSADPSTCSVSVDKKNTAKNSPDGDDLRPDNKENANYGKISRHSQDGDDKNKVSRNYADAARVRTNESNKKDDVRVSDPTIYLSAGKNSTASIEWGTDDLVAYDEDKEGSQDSATSTLLGRNMKQLERHAAENLEVLSGHLGAVKKAIAIYKKELPSALAEPYWGFELKMSPHKFKLMADLQTTCCEQASLLLKIIQDLQSLYLKDILEENPLLRKLNWATMFADMIRQASAHLEQCVLLLDAAFSDRRLRPQDENSDLALRAGIMFRNFEDVRLGILLQWSHRYTSFLRLRRASRPAPTATEPFRQPIYATSVLGVNPSSDEAMMVESSHSEGTAAAHQQELSSHGEGHIDSLEIRVYVAIAESLILEICRHLQKAGKVVEEIAHDYPRFEDSQVLVQMSDRRVSPIDKTNE
jgi:hypothetical protein